MKTRMNPKHLLADLEGLSVRGMQVFALCAVLFCCALIVSNVLAVKALSLGPFALPASILTFPIVYIINDVLSDIFGFKLMRSIILLGFVLAGFAVIAFSIAIALPGVDSSLDASFAATLGSSGRILLGSFTAYLLGSLLNSYVMSSLKERFDEYLFFRCILSTFMGEFVDSLVFITIAFVGVFTADVILIMIGSQVLFKVLYEIVIFPVTKRVIVKVRAFVSE